MYLVAGSEPGVPPRRHHPSDRSLPQTRAGRIKFAVFCSKPQIHGSTNPRRHRHSARHCTPWNSASVAASPAAASQSYVKACHKRPRTSDQ